MNEFSSRLLIIGGGTGGHIFPGIAIAHYLMKKQWKILWLGSSDRMESTLVPQHNIDIEIINMNLIRKKGLKYYLPGLVQLGGNLIKSLNIIKTWKPDVVLGMGGYISGAGIVAAWLYDIPIVIHEQNRIAGLTNRWLAKISRYVLQGLPGDLNNALVVGNPLRNEIRNIVSPEVRFLGRENLPLRVLVMGGSQGSQILNNIIPQVAMILGSKITVWHQVGSWFLTKTMIKSYQEKYETSYRISEFISDIAEAYSWADIVICRSGALTVSEISAVGLPAIFVPFPHKDQHQYWNAVLLEDIGAAKIIKQSYFTASRVAALLESFDRRQLLRMALLGRSIGIMNATEKIADIIERAALSDKKR
ncbi:MAG: undecaprenyldiphospho-muramoylpentapeptide beta-N-acetylglucosaminyltransferase [Candidatus Dasytiphilus stammeri]